MKTEVTRHIFDGGKLNFDGTEEAHENVVAEGRSCQSFRMLLGQEESSVAIGIHLLICYLLKSSYPRNCVTTNLPQSTWKV